MKNQSGFTIVELLMTLAIVSILIALVAPQFGTITAGNKQASAANALVTDLSYARDEAVTRNSDVTIAAKTGNWQNGWTVTTVDSTGTVQTLRDIGTIPTGVSVSVNPAGTTSLTYKADGSQNAGTATIKFCNSNLPANNNSGMEISIITSGRQTLNSNVVCP